MQRGELFEKGKTFRGLTDCVSSVVFDEANGLIYTASLDHSIKVCPIWSVVEGQSDNKIRHFAGLDRRDWSTQEDIPTESQPRSVLFAAVEGGQDVAHFLMFSGGKLKNPDRWAGLYLLWLI